MVEPGETGFHGKQILIVEDEYFLADEMQRAFRNLGAVIVGPVGHVAKALELISRHDLDAAILDINLHGEMVFPVAEKLDALQIPYLFASGYDASVVPDTFKGRAFCEKPVDIARIARLLFGSGKKRGDGV